MELFYHSQLNHLQLCSSPPLNHLCTKRICSLLPSSIQSPFYAQKGLRPGCCLLGQPFQTNPNNYDLLSTPRTYLHATWCHFKPTNELVRLDCCKFHNQDKRSRYIVSKSELTGTGSPGAAYPLSELQWAAKSRGVCFYTVTACVAIFLFVLMLIAHPFVLLLDRYRRKVHHFIAKIWAFLTIAPFFKIEFEGLENLPPPDTPAVYVSNHQSFLDIYALLTLGRCFKFISKTSIFLFPVVGWAMFMMGLIPLKRMDSRSQLDCLKKCMDLLKKGASVFFFPEGTRSKDGKLGVFKKGAFSIAVKTSAPVVPITLIGTGKIMPTGMESRLYPGFIRVVIHQPIKGNDPEILCNEARNVIGDTLVHQG